MLESASQSIELRHMAESTEQETHESLAGYYRVHSKIYDLTRWSFLFGRTSLVQTIAAKTNPSSILEVGCGTGTNMAKLARIFPTTELHGLDLSTDMLKRARRKLMPHKARTHFLQRAYNEPVRPAQPFDLILFSYSLSMFNPGWERALEIASEELAESGIVAVVDFHDTPFDLCSEWMAMHHVRLEGHLLTGLRERFRSLYEHTGTAWFGIWKYFHFIGKKPLSRSR